MFDVFLKMTKIFVGFRKKEMYNKNCRQKMLRATKIYRNIMLNARIHPGISKQKMN